ncbi:toxin-antitoxin system YwqK family antitoxin [Streptococcus oricebi]|uniref:Toxin-antitoxin system YwqK family antitoxin n=1 Tax=Streptococcus oricebi TaxID=1547447 RepID=A0ABS5B4S0_9STRE|nr:hypothetical protein [Streptococcus oricebi]MBP2623832.1 hypothetical protein [Streptococcus oricebi]
MIESVYTKEAVLRYGVNFEEKLDWGGPYGEAIVFYDENEEEHLFSGLTYDLFPNGEIDSYDFVLNGVRHGQQVKFYPNGNVQYINYQDMGAANGARKNFYEDGKLQAIEYRVAGQLINYKRYDRDGNIVEQKTSITEDEERWASKFGMRILYDDNI